MYHFLGMNLEEHTVIHCNEFDYLLIGKDRSLIAYPSDLALWLSKEWRLQRLFFLLLGMESITVFSFDL